MTYWRPGRHWLAGWVMLLLFFSCSSSRFLRFEQVRPEMSVRLFTFGGKMYEGLVLEKTADSLRLINERDGQVYAFHHKQIRQFEKSSRYHDYQGKPISPAELERYRTSRNTLTFAIGGMVLGGFAGLAVGYPLWSAEILKAPPFFIGGIGAIAGSLYFGSKGMNRDEWLAVQKVRYVREQNHRLQQELQAEEERLRQLEAEKTRLMEELKKKRKAQADSSKQEYLR